MTERIAVVTGSNTGIGLATVRALCKQLGENGVVYLTSRNEGRGKDALDVLRKEGLSPSFHVLDIDDQTSIDKLRDHLKTQHGGLDILVNNAGIALKDSEASPPMQAERSIGTNYIGLLNVTNTLLPLVRSGGRIVHVASLVGPMTYAKMSPEMQKRMKEAATEESVTVLMQEFVQDVKAGKHVQKGWANWSYGTSKLGVIALTRIQGREIAKDSSRKDILINACCPGLVETNMTAHFKSPTRKNTPDEGADNAVYLALLPPGTTGLQGKFLEKKEVKDLFAVKL